MPTEDPHESAIVGDTRPDAERRAPQNSDNDGHRVCSMNPDEASEAAMLSAYIDAAMRRAVYEMLPDGTWYGEIPALPGVWANAPRREEARDELRSVLEGWIILGLRLGQPIPTLDGVDLTPEISTSISSHVPSGRPASVTLTGKPPRIAPRSATTKK